MKEQSDLWAAVGAASSAGFTLLVCIGIGLGMGWFIDSHLFISPWGIVLGGLVGGATGLYSVYKQIVR